MKKSPDESGGPKNDFLGFGKNLIHSCLLFLLEYVNNNDPLTLCKICMSGKNLILELYSKNLQTDQIVGFFKLQYLTNGVRYAVEFFYVI